MEQVEALRRRIVSARFGGKVQRAHTVPHQGSYSVAEHSWGVAMLMLQLWPEDFPRLAAHCLVHDIAEAWTGDVPSSLWKHVPEVKTAYTVMESHILQRLELRPGNWPMEDEDYRKVKACDVLDLYLWCIDQCDLGNKHCDPMGCVIETWVREHPLPEPAMSFYVSLQELSPNESQPISLVNEYHLTEELFKKE